jgi:serine/threonine protein kinase
LNSFFNYFIFLLFRYLPLELLNSNERHYSADIFSFGICLYELVQITFDESGLTENTILPSDGPLWQKLRSGAFGLPEKTPLSLLLLIKAMMDPNPSSRPAAAEILTLPEVVAIERDPSIYAEDWKDLCFQHPRPASLNRTSSYDPNTMKM